MKKILIYSPLAILNPHFETELEIATKEIQAGNKVTILPCKTKLNHSCMEKIRRPEACLICQSRKDNGFKLLDKRIKILDWKYSSTLHEKLQFDTLKDFYNFKYEGISVGQFIISSFISNYREPKLNYSEYKVALENSLMEILSLVDDFIETVDFDQFDECYLFNGRFAILHPVMKIFQLRQKSVVVHERAGVISKYSLTFGTYPHDINYKKNEILEFCQDIPSEHLEKVGSEWFHERRGKSLNDAWPSFLQAQEQSKLPDNFNFNKRNITIFISSEEEFECIDGWENPLFSNQNEAVKFILQNTNYDIFDIYIRIHPNLISIDNSQTQGLAKLQKEFHKAFFLAAQSPIDSYSLLQASEKVLSFGSTIGVEANFWRTPTILVGRALYEHLDVNYVPNSKEELLILMNSVLIPKSNHGSFKFGYWLKEYGIPFSFFEPIGHFDGKFLGERVSAGILARSVRKLNNLKNRLL